MISPNHAALGDGAVTRGARDVSRGGGAEAERAALGAPNREYHTHAQSMRKSMRRASTIIPQMIRLYQRSTDTPVTMCGSVVSW